MTSLTETLEDRWQKFAQDIPANASDEQCDDLRQAFFRGAHAMLSLEAEQLSGGADPQGDQEKMHYLLNEAHHVVLGAVEH